MPQLYRFDPMSGPEQDPARGSAAWAERISHRLQIATKTLSHSTVHYLVNVVEMIWKTRPRPWDIWPEDTPFYVPDDYCKSVTGHDWNTLLTLIDDFSGRLDFKDMRVELAEAQAEHRSQGTRTDLLPTIGRRLGKQGPNTQEQLLRRLARDHPDILKDYKRGKYRSARAAAKAAGIIKELTPFEQIKRLLPKLTAAERRQLIHRLVQRSKGR